MSKQVWKPGNMLYPVPAVMVTAADGKGQDNIITIAWAGTVCSDPAMVSISVRKERYSHHMIKESGEFVINLVTEELTRACDLCGVKSGRDGDKFALAGLTRAKADKVSAPLIAESPVSLECKVKQVLELGSHDMFIAEVVAVDVDERYMDEKGKFCLNDAKLMAYSHGEYYCLGEKLGTFGYSVKKK
jgi:flavin reductase (DIM6/NTAB) family NADH-FMN oxidoreductase RutF